MPVTEDTDLRELTLSHLHTLVEQVATTSPAMSPVELVSTMERVSSIAAAVQAMAIATMADEAETSVGSLTPHGRLVPDPEFVPDEVALALHCSSASAHRRCQLAKDAVRHPGLMMGWAAGLVSPSSVQVIAELVASMDPADPLTDDLVISAVDYAAHHTPSQARSWLTRRVMAVDPEAAESRRRRAFAERKVVYSSGVDSMASLWALLPGVQARQVYDTVNAVARAAGAEDARTMDQRRADALVDLVVGRAEPPQVSIQVIATAAMLARIGTEPAEVVGVGPALPGDIAELLAELADRPSFRLLRADEDLGSLSAIGEKQYRPSAGLRRAVEARDLVCRFPGCRRTSAAPGTDLDHTVAWPSGSTAATNLAVLCRRHHRLKHSPGWQVRLDPDGFMTWTTPEGKQFQTSPWVYSDPRAP